MTKDLQFEHMFDAEIELSRMIRVGDTFNGTRMIADVAGGKISGPKLQGEVLQGAAGDWVILRRDGVLSLDVRLTIRTHDDALILMRYHGFRHGPAEVIDRLNKGETVDPSEYYFRTAPLFETGHERYYWMNNIVSVGLGDRLPKGPLYHVYQVL